MFSTFFFSILIILNCCKDSDFMSTFRKEIFIGSIKENLVVNTAIYNFANVFEDDMKNSAGKSELTFSMLHDKKGISSHFALDPITGKLYTKQNIDREEFCRLSLCSCDVCKISLTIIIEKLKGIILSTLTIEDENDNAPVFSTDNITFSLPENVPCGYIKKLDEAIDHDHGKNAELKYYLIDNNDTEENHFEIRNDPLSIEVIKTLDFEMRQKYSFKILVVDSGTPPLSATAQINIEIEDVNDNVPYCVEKWQHVYISEDVEIFSIVGQVKAIDLDSGMNGKINYRLATTGDIQVKETFEVNKITGEIRLLRSVDFESRRDYVIDIEAKDSGAGAIPVLCTIEIHVTDTNDNAPLIYVSFFERFRPKNETYDLAILENEPDGTFVGQLTIHDLDTKNNGEMTLNFSCDALFIEERTDNVFYIQAHKLDREQTSYHECLITVEDKGTPVKSSTKKLRLMVIDANDNAPEFLGNSTVYYVEEERPIGYAIGMVKCEDIDEGINSLVEYRLSEPSGFFNINKKGMLYTTCVLDREHESEYDLSVTASDKGNLSLSSTISLKIIVTDINDNKPLFQFRSYNFSVNESKPIGTIIGKLEASDRDIGKNGEFFFKTCIEMSSQFPFDIALNGSINVIKELDYEKRKLYEADVCVFDNGVPQLFDKAHVMFLIQNVNDNCPQIIFPTKFLYINRDMTGINEWKYKFYVYDEDGDDINVSVRMKDNLLFVKKEKKHQFFLYFPYVMPLEGYYLTYIEASDLNQASCNVTMDFVVIIGKNTTNKSIAMMHAQYLLEKSTNFNLRKSNRMFFLLLLFMFIVFIGLMFTIITIHWQRSKRRYAWIRRIDDKDTLNSHTDVKKRLLHNDLYNANAKKSPKLFLFPVNKHPECLSPIFQRLVRYTTPKDENIRHTSKSLSLYELQAISQQRDSGYNSGNRSTVDSRSHEDSAESPLPAESYNHKYLNRALYNRWISLAEPEEIAL